MRFLWIAFMVCGSALLAAGQEAASAEKIFTAASQSPTLAENLRVLTDEIGGRVSGTPEMWRAAEWAEAGFRAAGADSVTVEDFELPVTWSEGATTMEVTAPVRFQVGVTSVAWAPALAPVTARVVSVGNGSVKEFDKAGDIRGAIVLVHSKLLEDWSDLALEYRRSSPIHALAAQRGAVALAFMATRESKMLYRHVISVDGNSHGEVAGLPRVYVAREDGLRIERLLASGKKVMASLAIPNKTGPAAKSPNVIAEIKGGERPEEFVIVGAHLDSWEMGTGALDNGASCALLIDALRAIRASGLRPRRSIRFILFSGEEQGLLGSWAYADRHRDELGNVQAAIVIDSGTGRFTGYSIGGRKDVQAALGDVLAPLARYGADEVTLDVTTGSDHLDFLLHGVPTFEANQEPGNYMFNYHAASDTLDKVDMAAVQRYTAIVAYTAFALADMPQRLGKQLSRAEVEARLHELGVADTFKLRYKWADWEQFRRGRRP